MGSSAPDPRQAPLFAQEVSREFRECLRCKAPLTRRQKKYCSGICSSAFWDDQHPRVNRGPEGPREGTIRDALLGVMADGIPRTKADLAFLVRAHEHSVGTRLSELRRKGFRIESDAEVGCSSRAHRFRLVLG